MSLPLVNLDKIEITTQYCIPQSVRTAQISYAVEQIPGRIQPGPDRGDEEIAVVCYGPSLRDTLDEIKKFKYIITCSGAHKYLIDRGIIPTWHVDVDPREHKLQLLGQPHQEVEYLLCSAVHPRYVDLIKNYKVKLWHGYHEEDLIDLPKSYKRGEWIFSGGCTVGLRSLLIAKFLGFKKINVFGMDCSFPQDNDGEHADFHPNPSKSESVVVTEYKGHYYKTTYGMIEYARQFFREVAYLKECSVVVHGIGLLQHMGATNYKDPNEYNVGMGVYAFCAPNIATDEYINQNKLLHEINPYYGISGSKYIEQVLHLSQKFNSTDILDYGCGKGTLAKSMPFSIKEYDPAVPGKDAVPGIADLVVCTDVLEHIEPEYIDNVLVDIARCTRKAGYFVINTLPARKTLPDGRNTHLIQRGKVWWAEKIDVVFNVDEIAEDGPNLHVWVTARRELRPTTLEEIDNSKLEFLYVEVEDVKFVKVNNITTQRAQTLKTKEPITIEWIDSFNKDDIFVDVGANMGVYTLWAAKHHNIKTYAFEPESQNYALLTQNIYINGMSERIKAFNIALGNQIGAGELHLTDFMPGSSCHQLNSILDYNGNPGQFIFKQACLVSTLDFLVQNKIIEQPTHIKIDVDGLEDNVVLGAVNTLTNVKSLLIEVNVKLPGHVRMIKLLDAMGFIYDQDQVNAALRKSGPFMGIGEYVFRRT